MKNLKFFLKSFSFLILLAFLSGCYSIPETGRSSLNLVPESQLASASEKGFEALKQREIISQNPVYNSMLQRVGGRIAEVVREDMPNANWEYVVFENDKIVNAFAMPGGKIGIYTGMFKKLIQTDDDLAIVVGHEIAHVTARHGNERVSHSLLTQLGAAAIQIAAKDQSASTKQLILNAYGAGATYGYILSFSRKHESEADKIGLFYAARAGYNPEIAIPFWERMSALNSGSQPSEIFSTHPSGDTRIRKLREIMPEAVAEYKR